MATTAEEIHSRIERLSIVDQQRVLDFVQELQEISEIHQAILSFPKTPLPEGGAPAKALIGFTLPLEVVEDIERALRDTERIDVSAPGNL
jgi:hypothetical protein